MNEDEEVIFKNGLYNLSRRIWAEFDWPSS
jgi:hypothetical protein